MNLASLALRNLSRDRVRSALTLLGVATSIGTFLLLRTVMWAWETGTEFAVRDRVVTRHRVTFSFMLPKRYVDEVRTVPHVRAATWATWAGGRDPRHPREFFATFAVDPESYFNIYSEVIVPPEQLAAWKRDRGGAIVGDVLARRLGWKVGDTLTLESTLYRGTWPLTIDGLYTTPTRSVDHSALVFHWSYFNDQQPAAQRDGVGVVVSRVDDPARSAEVALAIDQRFEDRDTPTRSQDERGFNASFLALFSGILGVTDVVSVAILVIMALILGNTIAMGVRARTNEYGVLRAIGFRPVHVVLWIVGEGVALGAAGGALGAALTVPFINLVVRRFVKDNLGTFFRDFRVVPANVVLGLVLAATLGGIAALLPAWRAARLEVVDAIRRVA